MKATANTISVGVAPIYGSSEFGTFPFGTMISCGSRVTLSAHTFCG